MNHFDAPDTSSEELYDSMQGHGFSCLDEFLEYLCEQEQQSEKDKYE